MSTSPASIRDASGVEPLEIQRPWARQFTAIKTESTSTCTTSSTLDETQGSQQHGDAEVSSTAASDGLVQAVLCTQTCMCTLASCSWDAATMTPPGAAAIDLHSTRQPAQVSFLGLDAVRSSSNLVRGSGRNAELQQKRDVGNLAGRIVNGTQVCEHMCMYFHCASINHGLDPQCCFAKTILKALLT